MKFLSSFLMLLMSLPVFSGSLDLEYSAFYSHVRKLDNEDTSALQFAFGFKNIHTQALCSVESVKIVTQKKTIEVPIGVNQRFVVPVEKALKMAKAMVDVELIEPANHCDMSVQLETKPDYLKQQYSGEELTMLHEQYAEFFDNMGGFLSFLMPGTQGLILHFDPKSDVQLEKPLQVLDNQLVLSDAWLAQGAELNLSSAPIRITANIEKD